MKPRGLVYLIFLCLLTVNAAYGQNLIRIKGTVTDSLGLPVRYTSITLRAKDNATVAAFAITDTLGKYTITAKKSDGEIILTAHSLGYVNNSITVNLKGTKQGDEWNENFILKRSQTNLHEVVVKPLASKISVVKDTITFKADSFRNATDKVTEDLLKKIPGVDVAKNGQISVNGKPIKKILIEGDDLFNKNYTLLSKNLSAELVDKIQVIDHYNDNPLLKGVINTNDKVLNITLKKDRKKIVFGNASAEAGNDGRYNVSSNLISFQKKTKVFLFDSYNTVGRNPVPEINNDQSIIDDADERLSDHGTRRLVQQYKFQPAELDDERSNFNHTKMAALSWISRPTDQLVLKGLVYLLADKTRITQDNDYEYLLNGTMFSIHEKNSNARQPLFINGYVKALYQPNKNELFTYIFNSKYDHSSENTLIQSDSNHFFNRGINQATYLTHRLNYTNRIAKKVVWQLDGEYGNIHSTQTSTLTQDSVRTLPFTQTVFSSLNQFVSYPLAQMHLFSRFIIGNNDHNLDIETGMQHKKSQLNSNLDDGIAGDERVLADSFRNDNLLDRTRYYLSISGSHSLSHYLKVNASLESDWQCVNLVDQQYSQKRNYLYFVPKVGLAWKKEKSSFTAAYSYDTNIAEINDIYSGFVLTNYRTLQNSVVSEIATKTHSALANYSYADWTNGLTGYLNYLYVNQQGIFPNAFTLTSQFDIVEKIQTPTAQSTSVYSLGVDKLISAISSTLKLRVNINQNTYESEINGILNRNRYLNRNIQASLRSAFHGFFDFQIGTSVTNGYSRNQTETAQVKLTNETISSFATCYLTFSENLSGKIDYEWDYYNSVKSVNHAYHFLDFTSRYNLKKNKLSVTASGTNLLNERVFINSSVSNFSKQSERFYLLSRYVLFGIELRF